MVRHYQFRSLVASPPGFALAVYGLSAIALQFPLGAMAASPTDLLAPVCSASSGSNITCVYIEEKDTAPAPYKYFTGEVRNKLPNGSGVLVYANGDRYEGTVRNGVPSGKGMFLFVNNDRYEGDMKNGQPHGSGSFIFATGDRYTGDVRNGHPSGQGKFVYNSGNIYAGGFLLGQAKGNGSITFRNGIRCQGTFYNSSLQGKGSCSFPSGFPYTSYTGELRQGIPDGRGTLIFADGRKFSGEVRKGSPYMP
ncbi:MORN repeat-containing protein [Myxacorys almedinensis]|nr:hypothetical protein [Myxacorys almedinensis]